jgi:hypothetical protein
VDKPFDWPLAGGYNSATLRTEAVIRPTDTEPRLSASLIAGGPVS